MYWYFDSLCSYRAIVRWNATFKLWFFLFNYILYLLVLNSFVIYNYCVWYIYIVMLNKLLKSEVKNVSESNWWNQNILVVVILFLTERYRFLFREKNPPWRQIWIVPFFYPNNGFTNLLYLPFTNPLFSRLNFLLYLINFREMPPISSLKPRDKVKGWKKETIHHQN